MGKHKDKPDKDKDRHLSKTERRIHKYYVHPHKRRGAYIITAGGVVALAGVSVLWVPVVGLFFGVPMIAVGSVAIAAGSVDVHRKRKELKWRKDHTYPALEESLCFEPTPMAQPATPPPPYTQDQHSQYQPFQAATAPPVPPRPTHPPSWDAPARNDSAQPVKAGAPAPADRSHEPPTTNAAHPLAAPVPATAAPGNPPPAQQPLRKSTNPFLTKDKMNKPQPPAKIAGKRPSMTHSENA